MRKLWIEDDITIRDGIGHRLVRGWTHAHFPGIAVTQTIGLAEIGYKYTITHVDSGMKCGPFFKSMRRAQQWLRDTGPMTDWTRSAQAVQQDTKLKKTLYRYYNAHPPHRGSRISGVANVR
jgi:hypothetical protein